jgi:RHS repeat-associated protein
MITSTAFSSSPFLILKVSQVSQPFNPNSGSAVWTTYTYDGSGRATAVVAPDGASTTQTSYSGNSTTVTDAAGMWKTSTSDTFGNLTLLTEPNPAGGANWTTSYTYNALNQLTQVSMTRPQGTQTRTFGYTGTDMTTETNPENGTVTYTYDNAHNLMSKTDNIGQKTVYTRDAYARVTEIQHYVWQSGTLVEDLKQRVNYTYDTGTNGQGRLTGVTFGMNDNSGGGGSGTFTYGYGYNVAGRITSQTMSIPSPLAINLSASYGYDTLTEKEGKLLSMTYPTYGGSNALVFDYQYDSIGRLNGMTEDQGYGQGQQSMATATLGPAGQLTALSYDLFANGVGINETIGYNNLLQPTRMTAIAQYGGQTYMDVLYNFSPTQNNGRIVGSTDNVTGENVSYTYDALNRLSTASAGSMWGESYTYDGFGNLTSKSVTQSPAPAMSATYYANNQQMGISYDGNGNQTWDSGYVTQYTWNVENRLATTQGSGTTTWYSYDDRGRRVMKDANSTPGTYSSGNWEFYFYGIDGQKVMTLLCGSSGGVYGCSPQFDIHFGRKLLQSKGTPVVTDRLGSVRWNYYNTIAYYPWGEERTSTSNDYDKFGTYLRDSPGQDYARARYYNLNVGRFWSPDPAGIGAVNPGNPTSWNRYTYVLGDPINGNDPTGWDGDPAGIPGCDVSYTGDLTGPQAACSSMTFATTSAFGGWGTYTTAPTTGLSQDGTLNTVDQAGVGEGLYAAATLAEFWRMHYARAAVLIPPPPTLPASTASLR